MRLSSKININDFFKELSILSKHVKVMHWFNIDNKILTGFYNNFKLPFSLIMQEQTDYDIYLKAYENQTRDIMWKIDLLFEKIPNIKDMSILDLACGTGIYSMELARRGCKNVTGIDINPIQIKQANFIINNTNEFNEIKPTFEFINKSADSSSFLAERKYDIVLSFGLFYHLENPFRYLKNLNNLTNKYLFLQTVTHNNNSIQNSLIYNDENPLQNINGISGVNLIPHFNLVPKLLEKSNFNNIDLCIPPYFKHEQEKMIKYAKENKEYIGKKLSLWDKRFNGPKFFYYFCETKDN